MKDKITTAILTGAGIAGLTTAGATVYNTNETTKSNEKMHKETIESNERIEMAKIKSNERIEMERLEVDKYNANLTSKYDETEDNSEPILSDNDYQLNKNVSDKPIINTDRPMDDINQTNDSNTNCVISSVLEEDYLNPNFDNILQSAGFSFACFAFIGLFAGSLLALNLIIQNVGEDKINKFPQWIRNLFQYYIKYILLSNTIYLLYIISSQTIALLLGLYLFFSNV